MKRDWWAIKSKKEERKEKPKEETPFTSLKLEEKPKEKNYENVNCYYCGKKYKETYVFGKCVCDKCANFLYHYEGSNIYGDIEDLERLRDHKDITTNEFAKIRDKMIKKMHERLKRKYKTGKTRRKK